MNARYRKTPYTVFPRVMKSGITVWYYQTYIDGKRTAAKSTGFGYSKERDKVKSRNDAVKMLEELYRHNQLGMNSAIPTLAQWIARKHFWDWRKSEYVRGILLRSTKDKPEITESYVTTAAQITRDHILPFHGDRPIDEITPYDCEQLLFRWSEGGIANKTVNNRKSIYSTVLGEYERELKMRDPKAEYFNPWRVVKPLSKNKNPYGALSISEVGKLISPDGLALSNYRERIFYLASKLAFLTGMRIGEVCGLLASDVIDVEIVKADKFIRGSYLKISHTYDQKLKTRGIVKDKETRNVPITAELRDELDDFIREGQGRTGAYLFSFDKKRTVPINDGRLREWLYRRMENVGIPNRASRHIAFHSARRFFNSLLRNSGVSDNIIQKFTGHNSASMTEHYTDYLPEDLQVISAAQRKLLEGTIRD